MYVASISSASLQLVSIRDIIDLTGLPALILSAICINLLIIFWLTFGLSFLKAKLARSAVDFCLQWSAIETDRLRPALDLIKWLLDLVIVAGVAILSF
jgi:hypothetical protein